MRTCGIVSFSLRSLLKPTARKLRTELSAVINFAKFREERIEVYSKLTAITVRAHTTRGLGEPAHQPA